MKPNAKTKTALTRAAKTAPVLTEIRSLIESSRGQVVASANLALVARNWHIGRVVTEDIQRHSGRADYGEQLLRRLAGALTRDYGDGFSHTSLNEMRRFFDGFEILQAVPAKSWAAAILQAVPAKSSGGKNRAE